MKVRCDFNLEAWIKGVEIYAESEEDAKEKLFRMSLEDLLEAGGYVEDNNIKDIDTKIVDSTYRVKVNNIDYDITEYDIDFPSDDIQRDIAELKASLPQELEVEVEYDEDYANDIDELVADAVSDETGYLVNNCNYEILEVE